MLKIVNANYKGINSSVPVSEHISQTLALEGLFSIIKVIHVHCGKLALKFSIHTDSYCTSKLFKPGKETSSRLISNTILQKQLSPKLSQSLPKRSVRMCWLPSAINLSDCLTKIH